MSQSDRPGEERGKKGKRGPRWMCCQVLLPGRVLRSQCVKLRKAKKKSKKPEKVAGTIPASPQHVSLLKLMTDLTLS